ncbi:MAG TPA: hypothetical protein VFL27_04210 [Candidatus Dormibacteraeota bacterium]|nr:hypothetical protein [Candidatus Dormibacteraeota bacterium]
MIAESHSSSELLTSLLHGPVLSGAVFGRRQLRFGDYIVALTAPGTPRMPNGVECRVAVRAGTRVSIGQGRLVVGGAEIRPGPGWDPVPAFDPIACLPAGLEPSTRSVPPTDPAWSATLAGYLAGLVLLHGQRARARRVASRVIALARPVGATLLRHAERGEVPEPVHDMLRSRHTGALITSSPLGIAWLRGLVSAGLPLDLMTARVAGNLQTA